MSLKTLSLTELLDLEPPSWLIDGVIPVQGLTALYGCPGDGKSFIALDMALAVASGQPWQGHAIKKGCVVYISAEGGGGIGKRVSAWLKHHHISPYVYADVFVNFIVSTIRVHPESDDLGLLIEQTVNSVGYRRKLIEDSLDAGVDPNQDPDPPLFIIVDTLARCFEGDENQQEDMGNFIKGLDILRENHEATILIVHHTSKAGFSERGSSAFRGACDTMMFARKKGDNLTLQCTKQKDYEEFDTKQFELVIVPEWDSCVIERRGNPEMEQERAIIAKYQHTHPSASIREIADALALSKSSVHRRLQEMENPVGQ